jgi:aconitate hydratase
LIGMGVLPLEFESGTDSKSLNLSGWEVYDIAGLEKDLAPRKKITVTARDGTIEKTFQVILRIDTPDELEYYRHGGILQYVLRQLKAA